MMKKTNIVAVILAWCLIQSSCTKDFGLINTNPNAPIEVETEFLLRKVMYDYGEQMSYEGFVAGNLLGQYFTAVDFNLFDRHSLSEPQFGGNPWPILYRNLRDVELILDNSLNREKDKAYEGPARVLKAYLSANLTDLYGDVPFAEALKGKEGELNPSYDTQSDIYLGQDGILDQLERAIIALQSAPQNSAINGDLFYNGDVTKWITLARTLQLKYLIRISQIEDVSAEIQTLMTENDFIESNENNASFYFSDAPPNNFRMSTARVGDFNLFILSETMEDIMKELEDPRLATFFRPSSNSGVNYEGFLNGPNASEISISIADFSLSGEIFRERTSALQANFITAWESQFLLAEAALKGFIDADPKEFYDRGVELAFDYWDTEMPVAYLTHGPAAYADNGADPLEQIITQKWIANIINGYEGWTEYRRTGFPALRQIAASLNNNLIPVRMPYPTDEEALNAENFNAASASSEGNSINYKVWWDVN